MQKQATYNPLVIVLCKIRIEGIQYLAATGHDEGAQGAETQSMVLDNVRKHVMRFPMILT